MKPRYCPCASSALVQCSTGVAIQLLTAVEVGEAHHGIPAGVGGPPTAAPDGSWVASDSLSRGRGRGWEECWGGALGALVSGSVRVQRAGWR